MIKKNKNVLLGFASISIFIFGIFLYRSLDYFGIKYSWSTTIGVMVTMGIFFDKKCVRSRKNN